MPAIPATAMFLPIVQLRKTANTIAAKLVQTDTQTVRGAATLAVIAAVNLAGTYAETAKKARL